MTVWEKVKLKMNDCEAVDHKKAYLKEKMSLKSHERGKIMFQIRRITIQCYASNADALYRRHIGKREDPGNEETTEKRRALGTRMVPPTSSWTCALRRGFGVELGVFTGCCRQNY